MMCSVRIGTFGGEKKGQAPPTKWDLGASQGYLKKFPTRTTISFLYESILIPRESSNDLSWTGGSFQVPHNDNISMIILCCLTCIDFYRKTPWQNIWII